MSSGDFLAGTPYAQFGNIAADATPDARRTFIRKTYMHLTVAVYALVLLEFLYFQVLPLDRWVLGMFQQRWGWFALFGGYMLVSYIARGWAESSGVPGGRVRGSSTRPSVRRRTPPARRH